MPLNLSSTAFVDHGEIPREHTADGKNVAPRLTITGVPPGTQSLALVVDDPDAPRTPFAHWVMYDIPPTADEIGEVRPGRPIPGDATEGINDFGRRGYGGPKPPRGRHRYVFKLYALDIVLGEREPLTKEELEGRLEGHVLDHAELVGTYARAA